uniref:DUF4218 domain-containing protein n=1 Tax=Photinus pyralis TaxID=7054 RepID=A0A1Y1LQ64_PHOPY
MNKKTKLKTHLGLSSRHRKRLINNETNSELKHTQMFTTIEKKSPASEEVRRQTIYQVTQPSTSFQSSCSIIYDSDHDINIDRETSLTMDVDLNLPTTNYDSECLSDESSPNSSDIENLPDSRADSPLSAASINSVQDHSTNSIKEDLIQWTLEYNIPQNALTALLKVVNKNFKCNLPNDARTLLQTPRNSIISKLDNGQYIHFGLENALKGIVKDIGNLQCIELLINVDGLPLSRSSTACLWPILCSDNVTKKVSIVGLFHGYEKPKDSNQFLKQFVKEAVMYVTNGFFNEGRKYDVKIAGLICDAPAKSFVLNTKGHTGYNSCTKCKVEGNYINNRVCFPAPSNVPLRNDNDYFCDTDDDFYVSKSELLKIPGFLPVSGVPLDYMHLICLGVVKKLLLLWIESKASSGVKLSSQSIKEISENILLCCKYVPSDVARKPRPLSEIRHWKATELRNFLLYIGPVVLKSKVNNDVYLNFLTLHVAVRILCNSTAIANKENIKYAERLLEHFVQSFAIIYGKDKISHNVHNLLHICEDVRNFGSLDEFSSFKFENYMSTIKKYIRKNDKPLQQLCNRYHEMERLYKSSNKSTQKSVTHKINDCVINIHKFKDRCVLLENGDIFQIILIEGNRIAGYPLRSNGNLYTAPCASQKLNIHQLSDLNSTYVSHPLSSVRAKIWTLPYKRNEYVGMPILHSLF